MVAKLSRRRKRRRLKELTKQEEKVVAKCADTMANKWKGTIERDDFYQIGYAAALGLKLQDKQRPLFGSVGQFLGHRVRGAMMDFARDRGTLVKTPRTEEAKFIEHDLSAAEALPDPSQAVGHAIESDDWWKNSNAMCSLTPRERRIVNLRFGKDQPWKEIAKALGVKGEDNPDLPETVFSKSIIPKLRVAILAERSS